VSENFEILIKSGGKATGSCILQAGVELSRKLMFGKWMLGTNCATTLSLVEQHTDYQQYSDYGAWSSGAPLPPTATTSDLTQTPQALLLATLASSSARLGDRTIRRRPK
jgi:hypothetical protein